jgi:hypothetical protein
MVISYMKLLKSSWYKFALYKYDYRLDHLIMIMYLLAQDFEFMPNDKNSLLFMLVF